MHTPDLASHSSILNWLHGISDTIDEASPITHPASQLRTIHRKRKYCPPSPPLSVCMNASTIAKRARGAGDELDAPQSLRVLWGYVGRLGRGVGVVYCV